MKYKLTDETIVYDGHTLYRVQYEDGELGGWIESERNLSQEGNAWVYGDAWVYGNARVSGDARVYGDARVSGDAWVFGNAWVSGDARVYGDADWMIIGPIGSRNSFTTVFKSDSGLLVKCGCFSGTIEQFEVAVEKTHGDNKHGQSYKAMIAMVKARMQ